MAQLESSEMTTTRTESRFNDTKNDAFLKVRTSCLWVYSVAILFAVHESHRIMNSFNWLFVHVLFHP